MHASRDTSARALVDICHRVIHRSGKPSQPSDQQERTSTRLDGSKIVTLVTDVTRSAVAGNIRAHTRALRTDPQQTVTRHLRHGGA